VVETAGKARNENKTETRGSSLPVQRTKGNRRNLSKRPRKGGKTVTGVARAPNVEPATCTKKKSFRQAGTSPRRTLALEKRRGVDCQQEMRKGKRGPGAGDRARKRKKRAATARSPRHIGKNRKKKGAVKERDRGVSEPPERGGQIPLTRGSGKKTSTNPLPEREGCGSAS